MGTHSYLMFSPLRGREQMWSVRFRGGIEVNLKIAGAQEKKRACPKRFCTPAQRENIHDSLPLLCHFLIGLLLICLIRVAGNKSSHWFLALSLSLSDGKVYALGGMGADTTPQATVRLYEATKDQWLPLTSMPTPRYGAFSFLRGNKIYVLGMTSENDIRYLINSVVCQTHNLSSLGIKKTWPST